MEWMILPFKRFFDFRGRSRRKEFWMYTLFVVIVSIVLSILDSMLGLGGDMSGSSDVTDGSAAVGGALSGGLLANLFSLITIIPSLAVSVRRLHDVDRTGWWVLLPLLPVFVGAVAMGIGAAQMAMGGGTGMGGIALVGGGLLLVGLICAIVLLVWYCTAGTPGPNRFGEDPKGEHTNAEDVFG
ncbi:MAG: DUF805 domain-containing protein [Sphingomonas sp.]